MHPVAKVTTVDDASCPRLESLHPLDAERSDKSFSTDSTNEPIDRVASVISFDDTKAGLQGVDRAKTELLIQHISSGSLYYKNEERKAQLRARKVKAMLEKKKIYESSIASQPAARQALCQEVAELEQELEKERFFEHVFAHIDMDMFFAAVEEKKDPQLRDVPFGVGSLQMLSTTNYIARQYGVRSGMPGFIGKKLCPALVIVPIDYRAYEAEATVVRKIVSHYDEEFYSFGLDEQRLDLTNYIRAHFPHAVSLSQSYAAAEQVMAECRQRILQATQLTSSAGIGPTPTLAKMASNLKKPNGQCALCLTAREAVMEFLRPLGCRQIPGIGKSLEAILRGLGILKMGDLYDQRHWLYYIFTRKTFYFLLSSALGVGEMMGTARDDSSVARDAATSSLAEHKSVGKECTFSRLRTQQELQKVAEEVLQGAVRRLKRHDEVCKQVVLKLKHVDFHVKQYSKNLETHTSDVEVLSCALDALLRPILANFMNYRLLGVRLEKVILRSESERLLKSRSRSTLDRFLDTRWATRARVEPFNQTQIAQEEEHSLLATRVEASSKARARGECCAEDKRRDIRAPLSGDVVFIDSPSRSLSVEQASPVLSGSSTPLVVCSNCVASASSLESPEGVVVSDNLADTQKPAWNMHGKDDESVIVVD